MEGREMSNDKRNGQYETNRAGVSAKDVLLCFNSLPWRAQMPFLTAQHVERRKEEVDPET